jgi:hypothetical protein
VLDDATISFPLNRAADRFKREAAIGVINS